MDARPDGGAPPDEQVIIEQLIINEQQPVAQQPVAQQPVAQQLIIDDSNSNPKDLYKEIEKIEKTANEEISKIWYSKNLSAE